MPDMSFISIAANSVNAALNLIKATVQVRDATVAVAQVMEVNRLLIDAQKALLQAQDEIATLRKRVGELESQIVQRAKSETELENYELVEIADGCIACALKEAERGSAPPHYLCAGCYRKGEIGYLNYMRTSCGMEFTTCTCCGAKNLVQNYRPPQ